MDGHVTFDDLLNNSGVPMRQSNGRSSEEATLARRKQVLELYSQNLTAQIYRYVEGLGFSRKTAEVDIAWAKQEWKELNLSSDTHLDIIAQHKVLYSEYAHQARQLGDLRLAKEMMQAKEKLSGYHDPERLAQLDAIQPQAALQLHLLTPEQFEQFNELLKIVTPPASAD